MSLWMTLSQLLETDRKMIIISMSKITWKPSNVSTLVEGKGDLTPARRAHARLSLIAHSLASLDCSLFTFTTLASPITSLRFAHGALRAFVKSPFPYYFGHYSKLKHTPTLTLTFSR